MSKKVDFNILRTLQRVGNVLHNHPTNWERLDEIPSDFLSSYKKYLEAKDAFNEVLLKYDFTEI